MTPTLELAIDLIRRPSVTPKDEGCHDLITERLGALGFINGLDYPTFALLTVGAFLLCALIQIFSLKEERLSGTLLLMLKFVILSFVIPALSFLLHLPFSSHLA